MFGIDVSEHNGTINWDKVKSKIDFAVLRLGWIGNKNNNTIDKNFERNYKECKRLGIPVGAYIYNYCDSNASVKSGAEWTLEKLKGKKLELPVYFDIEEASLKKLGKSVLTSYCIDFNTIIEKGGFWNGVYANRDWFDNYLDKSVIRSKYTTWIADYRLSGTEQYKGEYDMWQNSENGRVDGVTGKVDTNYLYRNLISEIGNKTDFESELGDEEVKAYQNGNTVENVYSDTNCTNKIGSLNPKEKCDCLGIFNNCAIVRYKVDESNNYKIGFVKWLGGVK